MPGPTLPKDWLFEGIERGVDEVMEIIRKDKRLKSALHSSDGETADSSQMSMKEKKKRRKKISSASLSRNDEAQEHNKVCCCGRTLCLDADCGADYFIMN